jgi:phage shock protein C
MKDRLYKSRSDKIILGVCGGLSKYFDIDASIVRIVWAATAFFYGTGFLLYLIAAFILPYEDELRGEPLSEEQAPRESHTPSNVDNQRKVLAAILIVAGLLLLLKNFHFTFYGNLLWPLALVSVGAYLIIQGRNDHHEK